MNVVVLGAGYAGLTVARRLERNLPDDVDLTVVNESNEHLVQHELHRVIRRPEFAEELTLPLSDVLDRASIRVARVEEVDPDANRVALDGGELDYDYAAVCLGAETDFQGLPGVEEHGMPLKRPAHATRIRERFLDVMADGGRVVVGGAGLSGIQVAGELAELAGAEGADAVEIVLLEALDDVAPGFPRDFRSAIRDELSTRGVEVRTGTAVTGASDGSIELEDEALATEQLVWTGGIRGSSAMAGDRPEVPPTLRLGDGTFVVGDAARVVDRDGEAVAASAQAALGEARTAAANVRRLVEYDRDGGAFEPRLEAFGFSPRGWIVSVGNGAVAQVGPTVLRGRAALALKATVGVGYLTSVGAVREAVDLAREEFSDAAAGPQRNGDG